MKKFLFGILIVLLFISIFSENYLVSFSAAVKSWEKSDIDQAILLANLSLSSTINISYAPDLWYFKARLELMKGETKQAKDSLEMAASVFHPKAVYHLLNSLLNASVTSFSPITNVNYVNSIKGFYGGEVFYTPISVSTRYEDYYVLDASNRFVEEFGTSQIRHTLSVNSTPTSMVYSHKLDSFFISFKNGSIYEYSPDFSKKSLFATGFSYPVVSFVDNVGRVYVLDSGKDVIDIFECTGKTFKTFNFFNERVHILGSVREAAGIMYVMDFTDKSIRRFDVINGKELSSIPFPEGNTPTSFEILEDNVLFINSKDLNVGGINFPLNNSKSVFSSSFAERLLMTCDVESNKVNLYEVKTHSGVFIPVIDNLSFSGGKVNVTFRVLDPLGSNVENPSKAVINDNGFTKAVNFSRSEIQTVLHSKVQINDLFKMDKNKRNVVILKASDLKGHEKALFPSIILNNVTLYIIKDVFPSKDEEELVKLTGGDFVSQKEAQQFNEFIPKMHAFEFKGSYRTGLPSGVDEVKLTYGANNEFSDSVYYTLQNMMK